MFSIKLNFFALLLISTLLAGCATSANYEKVVDSWVGSSEDELIRKWGVPTSSYSTSDNKYITYRRTRIVDYGSGPFQKSCETTFTLQNERIVSWSFKGNDCIAFAD